MFRLKIETDGEAYREDGRLDPSAWEVRRNLAAIADKLVCGVTSGEVTDIYGNATGTWKYEE